MNQDLLSRYLQRRRWFEVAFWIALFAGEASLNSWTVWVDLNREGNLHAFWEPALWEWSSNLILLALIPGLLWMEARFPIRFGQLSRNVPRHFLATLVWSGLHIGLMVAIRKAGYAMQGMEYVFLHGWHELLYEYLKDARGWGYLLLLIGFYRLLLMRLQGEASLLDAPDDGPPVDPVERPERFLVRKLGKEYLLPAAEIEWLQAWGNYVNLRVRGHDYPLRATMASIEARLDPRQFVRVHRSYIVNLAYVKAIEPTDSGDAKALFEHGESVPVSRRYRDALRTQFQI
ncbi:LytTR family transcriptional regulator [Burkholderiaceae bacterium DAT-1]|nr:LytTR family transcriptional regulator [Burkholderiaceae bacterium DAT-1]